MRLDYIRLGQVIMRMMMQGTEGNGDVITAAVREVTKQPDLVLTKAERGYIKQIMFPVMYGDAQPMRKLFDKR